MELSSLAVTHVLKLSIADLGLVVTQRDTRFLERLVQLQSAVCPLCSSEFATIF